MTRPSTSGDYGDLVGLNKDDARKKWGEEQVHKWRRSYDIQPPGGESLKDTVARALPYYCQSILPPVLGGKRVLVAAHGNSLRALVMVLDRLTPQAVPTMELATGVPMVYRLNPELDRRQQGHPDRLTAPRRPVGRAGGGAVAIIGQPDPASRQCAMRRRWPPVAGEPAPPAAHGLAAR